MAGPNLNTGLNKGLNTGRSNIGVVLTAPEHIPPTGLPLIENLPILVLSINQDNIMVAFVVLLAVYGLIMTEFSKYKKI